MEAGQIAPFCEGRAISQHAAPVDCSQRRERAVIPIFNRQDVEAWGKGIDLADAWKKGIDLTDPWGRGAGGGRLLLALQKVFGESLASFAVGSVGVQTS